MAAGRIFRVLALEPYYGGSHRSFLDSWVAHSRHQWSVVTLPPYKWKWRMRHSALTLAARVSARVQAGESWDVLFCSDMLNLAEFLGLAHSTVSQMPRLVYMHENQLTYPVRYEDERDLHFALTNFTTCLAANRVWFNSEFHRSEFLHELRHFLSRMPDYEHVEKVDGIARKSVVRYPGVNVPRRRQTRLAGPLHILWAARWEHDKNPEQFFEALRVLGSRKVPFRVSVIGESFADVPEVFEQARRTFGDCIVRWGFQDGRERYITALHEADVIVSTAHHEFFGISVVEAITAGSYPLLPNRLSYPEIIALGEGVDCDRFLYDGTTEDLIARLQVLADAVRTGDWPTADALRLTGAMDTRAWSRLGSVYDEELVEMVH